LGHIVERFTRIALARGDLDLTLIHNERELYRLVSQQGLRQRISELFSSELGENLLEVKNDEKGVRIFALMGRPGDSRTSSKFHYVFLNGRFIRDKFISHAVKEAYRSAIEPNRFPVVFLFVQMPYEDYDVNVHPTKNEVRFYNANLIHSQVLGALREKLLATNLDTQAKLPSAAGPAPPEDHKAGHRSREIADAMAEFFKKHKPVPTQRQFTREPSDVKWMAKYRVTDTGQEIPHPEREFIQIHDSFIVAPTDDGFIIIDQHALHERILYEILSRRLQASNLESKSLLDEVLNMAACKAAIKAGQKLSDNEIEQLLADREKGEFTSHCPHGRPTTIKFSIAELQKQFKRT